MATSFGALCTDFYVNQKLALKMDLPSERETVLHYFERMRKSIPSLSKFRRFEGELALESSRRDPEYRWLALRRTSVRAGHVNPETMDQAQRFHRDILEISPHFLSINPLDVDYQELLFGFDLECQDDHDEVIFRALFADTPMAEAVRLPGSRFLDVQPVFGMSLTPKGDVQAYFEVKTQSKTRRGNPRQGAAEPISLFLSLRKFGPVERIEDLPATFDQLSQQAEMLATERLVPHLLTPIAKHITSGSA